MNILIHNQDSNYLLIYHRYGKYSRSCWGGM